MTFLTKPTRAFTVKFDDSQTTRGEYTHIFCGKHEVPGATCPNCSKPLLRFFSIDYSDKRLELPVILKRRVDLFFCWRCPLAQGPFMYRLCIAGGVEIVSFQLGEPELDFPYPEYPESFPKRIAVLEDMAADWQQAIILLNEGRRKECKEIFQFPIHQIGGIPYLVQFDRDFRFPCPRCGENMPFFATVGDDAGDGRCFTGNKSVQVIYHLCHRCLIVGAYQSCD